MTNTKKILTALGVVVLAVAIYGAYQYPKASFLAGAASPVNSTNSTRGFASINMNSTASSTSILNSSNIDYFVTEAFAGCNGLGTALNNTGAGVANLTLSVATTTTSAQGLQGNVNYIGNLTLATTTPLGTVYVSSTTTPFPSDNSRIWPAGTNMTFNLNATSTGMACTVGVSYFRL